MQKNSEYVLNLGLTYKRLGVYAFLILAIIGLIFTFIKIHQQKTNAYLLTKWFAYSTERFWCVVLSIGEILPPFTILRTKKQIFKFLYSLNYNDKILREKFPKEMGERANYEKELNDKKPFLSKILYYETLNF